MIMEGIDPVFELYGFGVGSPQIGNRSFGHPYGGGAKRGWDRTPTLKCGVTDLFVSKLLYH